MTKNDRKSAKRLMQKPIAHIHEVAWPDILRRMITQTGIPVRSINEMLVLPTNSNDTTSKGIATNPRRQT
jgi:hypothetical protein